MKIVVFGAGYVGLSSAVLLALKHDVSLIDIDQDKISKINSMESPFLDNELDNYLKKDLKLRAKFFEDNDIDECNLAIIATPTDYDEETNEFDTSIVENILIKLSELNNDLAIVIKSTVPVGFTRNAQKKFGLKNLFFSPEFLREGHAIQDNLFPSRVIIGSSYEHAKEYGLLMQEVSKIKNKTYYLSNDEAEAIKLMSNTYLAMRISFFNEVDSFAMKNRLNPRNIIEGICADQRIGDGYNNPSFGYGGYCLPKDTKQLLKNYELVPNDIIESIVKSNSTRKNMIAQHILGLKKSPIGIYRLAAKEGSDNFRSSAIQGVIERLITEDIEIILFEPELKKNIFKNCTLVNDLTIFKEKAKLIIANRMSEDLFDVEKKVFTRDIFNRD